MGADNGGRGVSQAGGLGAWLFGLKGLDKTGVGDDIQR